MHFALQRNIQAEILLFELSLFISSVLFFITFNMMQQNGCKYSTFIHESHGMSGWHSSVIPTTPSINLNKTFGYSALHRVLNDFTTFPDLQWHESGFNRSVLKLNICNHVRWTTQDAGSIVYQLRKPELLRVVNVKNLVSFRVMEVKHIVATVVDKTMASIMKISVPKI